MYFLKRFQAYFFLFIALETLVRITFLGVEWPHLDSWEQVIAVISKGFFFDCITFAYLSIPYSIYLMVMPKQKLGGHTDKIISALFYGIFAFILLFTSVSEWFFWDEFSARFNFIAVDYLIYTDEVIGNIRESYPVFPIIAAILLLSAFLANLQWQCPTPVEKVGFTEKSRLLFVHTAIILTAFALIDNAKLFDSENRFANEIGKNGIYELFSAYRNNELSYKEFYLSKDSNKMLDIVRKEIGGDFTGDNLTRSIDSPGTENHYNIVMITMESFSADYMAAFGNQENLTPYIDSLAKESLFFTNLYATGTRTVYGLSSLTLSIPPLPGNAIVRRPDNEHLISLGSILSGKGYDSSFIYGGFGYFDNMNYFFENNHYRIVDRTDLTPEEITFANIWGVADEDIYRRALKENDVSYAQGKPFFNMILTTSNHRPFTYPEGKIDIPSGNGRKGGVKYSDYAVKQFIESARAKPWFNNTIFVIVGDHTAGGAGKNELDPAAYHVPLIIYAPALIKPQKIDSLVSQIDVAPTLLGLLNADYESSFYGRDVLRNPTQRALISNYQKLGYLTPDSLMVLSPINEMKSYQRDNNILIPKDIPGLEDTALSYFQNASNWKSWNREMKEHSGEDVWTGN